VGVKGNNSRVLDKAIAERDLFMGLTSRRPTQEKNASSSIIPQKCGKIRGFNPEASPLGDRPKDGHEDDRRFDLHVPHY